MAFTYSEYKRKHRTQSNVLLINTSRHILRNIPAVSFILFIQVLLGGCTFSEEIMAYLLSPDTCAFPLSPDSITSCQSKSSGIPSPSFPTLRRMVRVIKCLYTKITFLNDTKFSFSCLLENLSTLTKKFICSP